MLTNLRNYCVLFFFVLALINIYWNGHTLKEILLSVLIIMGAVLCRMAEDIKIMPKAKT